MILHGVRKNAMFSFSFTLENGTRTSCSHVGKRSGAPFSNVGLTLYGAILQRGTEIEHGLHKAVIARLLTVSARIGHGITYSLTCTLTYHVPENGAALRFPT